MVEKEDFKKFVSDFILPLFSGTKISSEDDDIPKRNINALVTQCPRKGANYQKIMPSAEATYCLTIQRSLPFTKDEISFLQLFLKKADDKDIYKDMGKAFFHDNINSLITLAISETLKIDDISYHIIFNMLNWSQQTYEGQNIAMCIGVEITDSSECSKLGEKCLFQDIAKEDFFKVLSNGFDTMIVLNKDGEFQNLITLEENKNEKIYAPYRFSKVAAWTAENSNVAFVLNRNGEILIFEKGEIIFARRNGKWFLYSHIHAIKQLSTGTGKNASKEIKEAIYLTSLDVAFSRTGGCIGFVRKNSKRKLDESEILLPENNFAEKKEGSQKAVLQSIVNKKKFYELSRLLRMELVAIDGATIFLYNGDFISVGAILRLNGKTVSVTGGGRTVAAIALSEYGLGTKISNDGYIKFYTASNPDPILQIN